MQSEPSYSFSKLLSVIGGQAYGNPPDSATIKFLLTDSRQLVAPDASLFFAIPTKKNDGHHYVTELLQKGVRFFVVMHVEEPWVHKYPDAGFICLEQGDSPIAALQRLSAYHRSRFSYPVVGITGSNGKTIVKEWLFQLLSQGQRIVRSPKSFNSQIGLPLSVWQMTEHNDLAIIEAGISQPGEMAALEAVLKPSIGIFTNIGPAHNAGFVSENQKIKEKLSLFYNTKTLIYCSDHISINKAVNDKWAKHKGHETLPEKSGPTLFRWGRENHPELKLVSVEKIIDSGSASSSRIQVIYKNTKLFFSIPFTDDASIENAMHCVCMMLLSGLSPKAISEKMPTLQAVAMRLEIKEGINHCSVINDSYNSDLNSLAIALDVLNSQTRHIRKTLIISDILQTGMQAQELYMKVATLVKAKGIDRMIGIGTDISSQASLFSIPADFYPDTITFIRNFQFSRFHNEAILLKGARPFAFEKLGEMLQQKDHQTILEVDLDALIHNLNVFRARLEGGVKTMGMVKAFSYGSGSVDVASVLQYHNTDYLAVAYADEGKELRMGGIHLPIVVMNPEVSSFDTLLAYQLEPELYSLELLHRFAKEIDLLSLNKHITAHNPIPGIPHNSKPATRSEAKIPIYRNHNSQRSEDPDLSGPQLEAKRRSRFTGGPTHPIHIKLDTGMHRLGFYPDQLADLIEILEKHPTIKIASVFSHFAASDDPRHDGFSHEQIRVFTDCCDKLEYSLGYRFLRHMSNSAAIVRFPEAHFDMVRLGIGLYGISTLPEVQDLLQHVSTFKSVISQIKYIQEGASIGYNRKAVASKDMVIAIVPVGYADGLRRQLGNGNGSLLISGQKRPVVGDVSMDMCAVDVTGMDVKTGDEVIIFGKERPVDELAKEMNTIPYEVLTSVSSRVKRVYYKG